MRPSPSNPSFGSFFPTQTRKKLLPLLCTAGLLLLLPVVYQSAHSRLAQHHRLGQLNQTAYTEPFFSTRSWISNHKGSDALTKSRSGPSDHGRTADLLRGQGSENRVVLDPESSHSSDKDLSAAFTLPEVASAVPAEVLTAWSAGESYLRSEVSKPHLPV